MSKTLLPRTSSPMTITPQGYSKLRPREAISSSSTKPGSPSRQPTSLDYAAPLSRAIPASRGTRPHLCRSRGPRRVHHLRPYRIQVHIRQRVSESGAHRVRTNRTGSATVPAGSTGQVDTGHIVRCGKRLTATSSQVTDTRACPIYPYPDHPGIRISQAPTLSP